MSDEQITTPASGEYDNLEEIDGIGPGYAKALHQIGIRTFTDLADYGDADQLRKALLDEAGKDVPLSKIEKGNWIGQAKRLADRQTTKRGAPAPVAKTRPERAPLSTDTQTWRQYAGFSLFFDYQTDEKGDQTWQTRVWRTRAYHDESGEEVQFAGLEASRWARWILEQAGLPIVDDRLTTASAPAPASDVQPQAALAPPATPPAPGAETQIAIIEVQIAELAPSSGVPEKQLQAQVRLLLSGPMAERLVAYEPALRLEVHLVELELGAPSMLASRLIALTPGMLEYTSQLHFAMPPIGRYQLYCVALMLPPGNLAAFFAGPVIRIVS